jgi:hypothetical protein
MRRAPLCARRRNPVTKKHINCVPGTKELWSSELTHLNRTDDALLRVAPMLERISN